MLVLALRIFLISGELGCQFDGSIKSGKFVCRMANVWINLCDGAPSCWRVTMALSLFSKEYETHLHIFCIDRQKVISAHPDAGVFLDISPKKRRISHHFSTSELLSSNLCESWTKQHCRFYWKFKRCWQRSPVPLIRTTYVNDWCSHRLDNDGLTGEKTTWTWTWTLCHLRSRPVRPSCPFWIFQLTRAGPGRAGPGVRPARVAGTRTALRGWAFRRVSSYNTGKLLTVLILRFVVPGTYTESIRSHVRHPAVCTSSPVHKHWKM